MGVRLGVEEVGVQEGGGGGRGGVEVEEVGSRWKWWSFRWRWGWGQDRIQSTWLPVNGPPNLAVVTEVYAVQFVDAIQPEEADCCRQVAALGGLTRQVTAWMVSLER